MNRSIFVCTLMIGAAVSLAAQQAGQSGQFEGTSKPPSNDVIVSDPPMDATPAQKPSPAHASVQSSEPARAQDQIQPQPRAEEPAPLHSNDGIVQIAPDPVEASPSLSPRAATDPDGDIVHPQPLGPNEIDEGTLIRVRLLDSVSTSSSKEGESFRGRVASDVVQDDHVLIPQGSEIDGHITHVSSGSFGGHGSMNLAPETVILPNGSRFRMYGQVTSTPGSNTRIGGEGTINPGSHLKRNGIEYGGAVGAGAITGAVLGGPAGALAGSIIGAGVITAHLLISHPQATLDEGSYLQFALTERLNLVPAGPNGN